MGNAIYKAISEKKTKRRIFSMGLCVENILFLDTLRRVGLIDTRSRAFEDALDTYITDETTIFEKKESFINGNKEEKKFIL